MGTLWNNHGEDKEREEAGYAELRGDGEVPGGTFGMDGAEKAGGDMSGAVDPCFSGGAMPKLRVWALSLTKPPFSPALCWPGAAPSWRCARRLGMLGGMRPRISGIGVRSGPGSPGAL